MYPWILKSSESVDVSIDSTHPLKSVDASMDSDLGGIHEGGYMMRERKCGEFNRTLIIPPDTTASCPSHSTVPLGLTHLPFAD
jgi:hypothetical protein